jgi:hypothetical protein
MEQSLVSALANCVLVEIERLEQAGRGDWRSALLRKVVHETPREMQPTPDGLSRQYVEIAKTLNNFDIGRRATHGDVEGGPLLSFVEALIQAEIARALLNEHELQSRFRRTT